MSAPTSPGPLKVLLLTGLLCLIWGSTWIVIQAGLEDLPPFTSAAVRFAIAAAGMSVLAALLSDREGGGNPSLALSLVLGLANFTCSYGIVYWSETRLSSSLVSVLWATYPMFQALSGHLFLPAERLGRAQFLGFALGFAGVASLFATDLQGLVRRDEIDTLERGTSALRALGPHAVGAGAILLLSPLVSALGTTYVKKHGAGTSSLKLNRNGMCIGASLLGLCALLVEHDATVSWTRGALLSVLYLSLFGTVIAFGLYFWLLRHTPANRLSVISYVTPVVALVLGVSLRDEPVTPFTVAGLAAILAGVFLVHWGGRGQGSRVEGPARERLRTASR